MGKGLGCLIAAGAGLLIVLVLFFWIMGIYNGEVRLHARFDAQKKKIETSHDTTWKTLQQQFQIKSDYEDTFKAGLQALASGRSGGSLFKSVTESNSQLGLSTELYGKLMNAIEGKRAEFQREQNTLVDVWREHKVYCSTFPNSFFVGGKVLPEPVMITSTRTQEAVRTGRDDNVKFER